MKAYITLLVFVFSQLIIGQSTVSAQGAFSLSAGPDFATLQFATDGTISFYDKDGLDIGLAVPTSVTGSYMYDPFYSSLVDDEFNFHVLLSGAAGMYGGYQADHYKVYAALGYGALLSSEPFTYSFDEEFFLNDDFYNHLKYGFYARFGASFQKFGLRIMSMSDLLQVFGTYDLTEKIFAGAGYRRLLNGVDGATLAGLSIPGLQKFDGFQVTLGVKL
ncbi:hypothetical protein WJR50_17725 [Catalinimonas sp. 4WD22]|uniref:hypothetical protein n=1 Tax=Catalinimonas locisalis TaxID=3133978 RepID=UPI0031013FB7